MEYTKADLNDRILNELNSQKHKMQGALTHYKNRLEEYDESVTNAFSKEKIEFLIEYYSHMTELYQNLMVRYLM